MVAIGNLAIVFNYRFLKNRSLDYKIIEYPFFGFHDSEKFIIIKQSIFFGKNLGIQTLIQRLVDEKVVVASIGYLLATNEHTVTLTNMVDQAAEAIKVRKKIFIIFFVKNL